MRDACVCLALWVLRPRMFIRSRGVGRGDTIALAHDASAFTRFIETSLNMIRITSAASIVRTLWPDFEQRDGAFLLAGTATPQLDQFASLTEAEAFYSHTHLVDLFDHKMQYIYDADVEGERPDPSDPEHILSWNLAQRIAQMWLQKLRWDFPTERFRVYATRYDDPIVRFHKVRDGETLWLQDSATDISDPGYVVFDTAILSPAGTYLRYS